MTTYTPEEEILARGEDDWVQFFEVYELAKKWAEIHSANARTETVRLLRSLLSQRLVQIGDVTEEGFVLWELNDDEVIARVIDRWDNLKERPSLGDVCWLSNTARGDARARELLADPNKRWSSET